MNTATCSICSQSVPLDDNGRLEWHDLPTDPAVRCFGSGTTPQAIDGAEKVESIQRYDLVEFPSSFAGMKTLEPQNEGKLCYFADVEQGLSDLATLNAQARERIAGLEKDGALLDLFDAHDLIYEYTIAGGYDNWHKVHRISGYGLLSAERARLPWHKTIRAALDAARDKKGTE